MVSNETKLFTEVLGDECPTFQQGLSGILYLKTKLSVYLQPSLARLLQRVCDRMIDFTEIT